MNGIIYVHVGHRHIKYLIKLYFSTYISVRNAHNITITG